MKKSLGFVSVFFLVFVAVNFVVGHSAFKKWFYSKNPVSFFYIGYDWRVKNSRVLLESYEKSPRGIAFFGTSQTVFSIDPSRFSAPIKNYGLFAASQEEINSLLESALRSGNQYDQVLLEVNVMSLSKKLIERNRASEKAKFLHNSQISYYLPIEAALVALVPIVRYSDILLHTLKKDFFESRNSNEPSEVKKLKRQFHQDLFSALDRNSDLGYLPVAPVQNEVLKQRLIKDCSVMVEWNVRNGIDESEFLEPLRQSIVLARKLAKSVVLWIPPSTDSWKSKVPDYFLSKVNQLAQEGQIQLLNLSGESHLPTANDFVDCAHLNAKGAGRVSQKLSTILKIDSR